MERNKKFCLYSVVSGGEEAHFIDYSFSEPTDLLKKYAFSDNIRSFIEGSEKISVDRFASLEQNSDNCIFTADININTDDFVIWKDDDYEHKKLSDEVSNLRAQKKRLFVDMDGTLAVFKHVDTLEKLYEPGYFKDLEPNINVVNAVKEILAHKPDIDVYILSSVLSDSNYALKEKREWLEKYLPEIPIGKCIFPPCGQDKTNFVPGGLKETDYLLDDYSKNLNSWEPPARGIKLMNGINGNHGTWTGSCIDYQDDGRQLADEVAKIVTYKKEDNHDKQGCLGTVSKWQEKAEKYIDTYQEKKIDSKNRKDEER